MTVWTSDGGFVWFFGWSIHLRFSLTSLPLLDSDSIPLSLAFYSVSLSSIFKLPCWLMSLDIWSELFRVSWAVETIFESGDPTISYFKSSLNNFCRFFWDAVIRLSKSIEELILGFCSSAMVVFFRGECFWFDIFLANMLNFWFAKVLLLLLKFNWSGLKSRAL